MQDKTASLKRHFLTSRVSLILRSLSPRTAPEQNCITLIYEIVRGQCATIHRPNYLTHLWKTLGVRISKKQNKFVRYHCLSTRFDFRFIRTTRSSIQVNLSHVDFLVAYVSMVTVTESVESHNRFIDSSFDCRLLLIFFVFCCLFCFLVLFFSPPVRKPRARKYKRRVIKSNEK